MKLQEYFDELKVDSDIYDTVRIDKYDCLLLNFGMETLLYTQKDEISYADVRDFIDIIMERFKRKSIWDRHFGEGTGIAVIISESGATDMAKSYVKSTLHRDVFKQVYVFPVVVDLKTEDVSLQKRTGYFGALSVLHASRLAKPKFSLNGRLKVR